MEPQSRSTFCNVMAGPAGSWPLATVSCLTKTICASAPASEKRSTKRDDPLALIASGDLSHRLKPDAPAGYNPTAYIFDEEVVDALRTNSPERIINIDHDLRRSAGECGYRSMLIAMGATREQPWACEVIHYEAPFGVGYLVAQLTGKQHAFKSTREQNDR